MVSIVSMNGSTGHLATLVHGHVILLIRVRLLVVIVVARWLLGRLRMIQILPLLLAVVMLTIIVLGRVVVSQRRVVDAAGPLPIMTLLTDLLVVHGHGTAAASRPLMNLMHASVMISGGRTLALLVSMSVFLTIFFGR